MGNVSLLRGWQQHPRIDVVTVIISTKEWLIHFFEIIFPRLINKCLYE